MAKEFASRKFRATSPTISTTALKKIIAGTAARYDERQRARRDAQCQPLRR